ncbi:MAG: hypothetical protein AAGF76_14575, partial [Pseudomonadota bacterium]
MRSPARTRALTDVLAPTVGRALALALAVALSAGAARAETDHSAAAARVLEGTVLPGTAGFVAATDALVAAAPPACGDVDPAAL